MVPAAMHTACITSYALQKGDTARALTHLELLNICSSMLCSRQLCTAATATGAACNCSRFMSSHL
jgi:hypothetical protein